MKLMFDPNSMDSYRQFIKLKSIPKYEWKGRIAVIPDEYAHLFTRKKSKVKSLPYEPSEFLFDYQRDISRMAIERKKFSVFAHPGMGKTLIFLEYARHVVTCLKPDQSVLIVSPLMVVDQTIEESIRFYGDDENTPVYVPSAKVQSWMNDHGGRRIAITNYESIREGLTIGNVGCLILEESSTLKNMTAAWATRLIDLGRGLEWKSCYTGTPAPNDEIEYANHAVFMDHKKTTNEFLASYFVNRGQTDNRWEMKGHARNRFYSDLSHWCIFLSNPATYGWKDNCNTLPPIHIHVERIELTDEQRKLAQNETGTMFATHVGGIGQRGRLSQIAKGKNGIATNKPSYIKNMVDGFNGESTIIWCKYDDEQLQMERIFPEARSIKGPTPHDKRMQYIREFKAGERRIMISKAKCLGLGLNLQIATRHVFSGISDSYEEFIQCVKRSNRIGSESDLHVHIPVTELEEPMMQNVLRKADRVEAEIREQEHYFKQNNQFVKGMK